MAHVRPIPYLPEGEEDERSRLLEYLGRAGGGALPGAGPSAEGLTEAELYGSGSPGPRPSIEVGGPRPGQDERWYLGAPDYSRTLMTPGEILQMDPGFQAIARGDPREEAPYPLAADSPEVKAEKYEARRRYVQEGPRPLPAADRIAQQTFGKSWAELTPEEQERLMPSRAGKFRRAGKVIARDKPPTGGPTMTAGEARASRDRRAQEKLDREAGERETQAARRGRGGAARTAVGGETVDRLRGMATSRLGIDTLDASTEERIAAISRLPRKKRDAAIISFTKDLDRKAAGAVRGGTQATPEKREQQILDFEAANEHTGLTVRVPGRYTDVINKRGSAKVETEIATVNRAMHASARMIELDREYSKIDVQDRLTERALEIADEYDFLKDEHQGIILKISGAGAGDKESREHIKEGLPDIRTTLAHFSAPQLRALHNMLMLNGKAMLMGYGIEVNEHGIGNMFRKRKKKRKPPGEKTPAAPEAEPDSAAAFDEAMGL